MTVYKKHQLYVMTKAKDLAKYIITITEKSPKKYRYTLVARLQNYVLDVLECLHLANSHIKGSTPRINLQEDAKRKLALLDYFAQLAMEQGCILFKQYEQISKLQAEALMYLNKWSASDKRVSPNSVLETDEFEGGEEETEPAKIDWEKATSLVDI